MVRISWPLAVVAVVVIVIVARQPRLFVPALIVFALWFVLEWLRARRHRRR